MTAPPFLGPGPEFDRIRTIAAELGDRARALGDDCAVLPPGEGTVVVSTDASVEGVHFRLDWITLEEAGWRAAAGALSDLAADGAEAAGVLAAVMVPPGAAEDDPAVLMRGVGGATAAAGAMVLGGDLTSGPVWGVTVTVIGRTRSRVTRSGARPGDGLWLTGSLGGARAALESWRRGDAPTPAARDAFVHPTPRIQAGTRLASAGTRAMIDLSDGLGADAGHLGSASRVGIALELERVPVAADALPEASRLGIPPARFAAEGGEDYELLAALPPEFGADHAAALQRALGLPLTRIGSVVAGAGVRATLDGEPVTLHGWDHFR